jgi:hypothetical protein
VATNKEPINTKCGKIITIFLEEPFQKWGLNFIKPIIPTSHYFGNWNQYILLPLIMLTSGWRQKLYAPIQLLLQ